jgi:uncharacterized protein (TIGR03437 family)
MKRPQALVLFVSMAALAAAQAPSIGSVTNAATCQANPALPLAPGMLFTIFGSQLANQIAQPSSLVLSSTLGGVSVQFENNNTTLSAPLSYVQPDNPGANVKSQINAQVPWELAATNGGTTTWNVVVNNNGALSPAQSVTVGGFSPGVFASNGRGIVENLDGTLAWPAGVLPPLITHSANPGDTVIIYATGLGAVNPSIADGANSLDQLRDTVTIPVVMVGGQPAQVTFSGLSPQFPGVNQLNVVIPNIPANDNAPIQIQIGGITTPSNITMSVGN